MHTLWPLASVVLRELWRRKDFYVLFVLTALLCLLMGGAGFVQGGKLVRSVREVCLLLVWICSLLIAITAAARQLPQERESRTLFPLLAKPVTRGQVLLGKFLGCWLAAGAALAVFYLFFGILVAAREHQLNLVNFGSAFLLHWLMLAIVVAMTLLGSLLTSAVAANATACFLLTSGILLFGRSAGKALFALGGPLASLASIAWFAVPRFDLFDAREWVTHDLPPLPPGQILLSAVYAAAMSALFLLLARAVFQRRELHVSA